MSFRLVPKSVTLNDLERRNGPYFALCHRTRVRCRRKCSRSLSHLLISSLSSGLCQNLKRVINMCNCYIGLTWQRLVRIFTLFALQYVTDSGKAPILRNEGHERRTPEGKSRNTPVVGPVRRYPSTWARPPVFKTVKPTKERIRGVGTRPSTSVKIRGKKRRKRK